MKNWAKSGLCLEMRDKVLTYWGGKDVRGGEGESNRMAFIHGEAKSQVGSSSSTL
jgi:hypothetical protein